MRWRRETAVKTKDRRCSSAGFCGSVFLRELEVWERLKMAKSETKTSRREFLKAAGLTGAAAGAAAVVLSESQAQAAKPAEDQQVGYRETEHVKTYYELARF